MAAGFPPMQKSSVCCVPTSGASVVADFCGFPRSRWQIGILYRVNFGTTGHIGASADGRRAGTGPTGTWTVLSGYRPDGIPCSASRSAWTGTSISPRAGRSRSTINMITTATVSDMICVAICRWDSVIPA